MRVSYVLPSRSRLSIKGDTPAAWFEEETPPLSLRQKKFTINTWEVYTAGYVSVVVHGGGCWCVGVIVVVVVVSGVVWSTLVVVVLSASSMSVYTSR